MDRALYREPAGNCRDIIRLIGAEKEIPGRIPAAGYSHLGLVSIRPGPRDLHVDRYFPYFHFVPEGGAISIVGRAALAKARNAGVLVGFVLGTLITGCGPGEQPFD